MARGKGRQRRKRRRGNLSRVSYPPVNPEHTRWVIASVGESREADAAYRRAKAEVGKGERRFDEASFFVLFTAVYTWLKHAVVVIACWFCRVMLFLCAFCTGNIVGFGVAVIVYTNV